MNINNQTSPSLEVFNNSTLIFSHDGKWLHPLFALEEFLTTHGPVTGDMQLRDKIIGKAAAMLIYRLGFRTIHAGIISSLAVDFLQGKQVKLSWDQLVDQIQCRTEALYADKGDVDQAWSELRKRAGLE